MPAFEKYVIADAAAKLRQSAALAGNFLSVSKASNPGVFVRSCQGAITEDPAPSSRFRGPRSNKSLDRTPVASAALRGCVIGGAGHFNRYAPN